ncbi:hypothetical protein [Jiangella aurantiaca]|nr:hypothetical protein [Jiangella aurantiaca]
MSHTAPTTYTIPNATATNIVLPGARLEAALAALVVMGIVSLVQAFA